MARHITTIDTNRSADEVFDFLCDMRNASKWDPGVVSATVSVPGVTPTVSEGTVFDVTLKVAGRERHVTYRVTGYNRPRRVVLDGTDPTFRSLDTITVESSGDGHSKVTYEAVLEPLGKWKIAAPLVAVTFARIFRQAEAGLIRELGG
jgi:hypothetical protein